MKSLFLLILLILTSCSMPKVKSHPEHVGVDPKLSFYVDEYFVLAQQRGIIFNRPVTVGFKNVQDTTAIVSTIGVCTYGFDGKQFREIDIDPTFWNNEYELRKKALIFHELTHCYCGRNHTYGEKADILYPSNSVMRFLDSFVSKDEKNPAYLEDGCPSSIMHPIVLDDQCMLDHYDYYIDEMFNRCKPW